METQNLTRNIIKTLGDYKYSIEDKKFEKKSTSKLPLITLKSTTNLRSQVYFNKAIRNMNVSQNSINCQLSKPQNQRFISVDEQKLSSVDVNKLIIQQEILGQVKKRKLKKLKPLPYNNDQNQPKPMKPVDELERFDKFLLFHKLYN